MEVLYIYTTTHNYLICKNLLKKLGTVVREVRTFHILSFAGLLSSKVWN